MEEILERLKTALRLNETFTSLEKDEQTNSDSIRKDLSHDNEVVEISPIDEEEIKRTVDFIFNQNEDNNNPLYSYNLSNSVQDIITARRRKILELEPYSLFKDASLAETIFLIYNYYIYNDYNYNGYYSENHRNRDNVFESSKNIYKLTSNSLYYELLVNWIPKTHPFIEKSKQISYSVYYYLSNYITLFIKSIRVYIGETNPDILKKKKDGIYEMSTIILSYLMHKNRTSDKVRSLIDDFYITTDIKNLTNNGFCAYKFAESKFPIINWMDKLVKLKKYNNGVFPYVSGTIPIDGNILKTWEDVIELFLEENPSLTTIYKIVLVGKLRNEITSCLYNGYTIEEFIAIRKQEEEYFREIYDNEDEDNFVILKVYIKSYTIKPGYGSEHYDIILSNNDIFCVHYPSTRTNCLQTSAILSQYNGDNRLLIRKRIKNHPLNRSGASIQDIEKYYSKKVEVYQKLPPDFTLDSDKIQLYSKNSHIGYISDSKASTYLIDKTYMKEEKEKSKEEREREKENHFTDLKAIVFWDVEFSWTKKNTKSAKRRNVYSDDDTDDTDDDTDNDTDNDTKESTISYIAEMPNLISAIVYNDQNEVKYKTFSSMVAFVQYLLTLSMSRNIICYSHNGKRIEHHFLIETLLKEFQWGSTQKYLKLSNVYQSHIKSFQFKNIHFVDSSLIIPMPLEEISKIFKTDTPKDHLDLVEYINKHLKIVNYTGSFTSPKIGKYYSVPKEVANICNKKSVWNGYLQTLNKDEEEIFYNNLIERISNANYETLKNNWYIDKVWDINNPNDVLYVNSDVYNLAIVMLRFNDLLTQNHPDIPTVSIGKIKWGIHQNSLSSIGKRIIIRRNPDILHPAIIKQHFEAAYHGGRCELFSPSGETYCSNDYIKIIKIDINSSYPFQACQKPPSVFLGSIKKIPLTNNPDQTWAMWCIIRYTRCPGRIGPLIDSTGEYFTDTNNHLVLLWKFEYENIPFIFIEEIKYGFLFSTRSLANPIMDWYEEKKNSTGPKRQLFKWLLNSSLGSFGLKTEQPINYIVNEEALIKQRLIDRISRSKISLGPENFYLIKTTLHTNSSLISHPIACYITAMARLQLYQKMIEIQNSHIDAQILYCDTDAIILIAPATIAKHLKDSASNEIGGWDYNEYKYAKIWGKKKYQLDDQLTLAGISKTAIHTPNNAYNTRTIHQIKWTINNFRPAIYDSKIRIS